MVPVAAAVIVGILAGRFGPLPVSFYAVVILAALIGGLARRVLHHVIGYAGLVLVCITCLAAIYVQLGYFSVGDGHILTYTGHQKSLATLRGRVVTAPALWEDPPSDLGGYRLPPRTVFVLRASAIRAGDAWAPADGLVRVTVQEGDPRLAAGQELELAGWIGRYRGPGNPGQRDWAAAARNDGLLVWMMSPAPGAVTVRSDSAGPIARALWRFRAMGRQHLMGCGDRQDGLLLNAMVLGERHPALRRLNEAMVRAGVAHFLSISGLHLGIFLGFVFICCRLATLSSRTSAIVVLILLAGYLLMAQPRPPLLRSAIMAAALCVATIVRRRTSLLNALAVAAVVLLLIDPMHLFDAGFQMSFILVGGILLGYAPARRLLFGHWLRRRGLMVFRQEHRFRRWLMVQGANIAISSVTIALVAYLAAAPLVAYHFGLVTPWGALFSLLLLPVVTGVLVAGYLSMGLALVFPNLSYLVGRTGTWAADRLAYLVELVEQLPGIALSVRPVPIWWVGVCYGVMVWVLARRRLGLGRWAVVVGLVILAGTTAWTQRSAPAPNAAELNLLAVGPGQCAVLRTPSGQTFLIDAGTQGSFDMAETVLLPFLRDQRLPAPTAAFVSHANTDHYNGLPGLLARDNLKTAYVNGYFGRDDADPFASPPERLLRLLDDHGVTVARLGLGDRVQLDDRTRVDVLWPTPGLADTVTPNDRSLVLKVTCDDRSVLLPGDAQAFAQDELLTRANMPALLIADALVLPHHGAWSASLPQFVGRVSPTVAIISTGKDLDSRATTPARRAFYDQLRRTGRLYTTQRDGWIQLRFGQGVFDVRTMRQLFRKALFFLSLTSFCSRQLRPFSG